MAKLRTMLNQVSMFATWLGGTFSRFKALAYWLTISPTLIFVTLFTVFPVGYALYLAVHRYVLTRPNNHDFLGLRNFDAVLVEKTTLIAAINTGLFSIINVISVLLLGLVVALLLNRKLPGFGILGGLMLIPWAVPVVSAGTLWKLLVNGNFGALNGILYQLGVIDQYYPFLGMMPAALISVSIASLWRSFPFATILFLAGLQTIPQDCYSAAQVDGASRFNIFRYITFPLLRPTFLILLIFQTMISISTFDVVYVMTGGGPGTGTTLIAWLTYLLTFTSLNLGQGAALSLLITVVMAILVVLYMRLLTERQED